MLLIHPFTHTLTHRRRSAAMQSTHQLVRSNCGPASCSGTLRQTEGRNGTSYPPTARSPYFYIFPLGRSSLPSPPRLLFGRGGHLKKNARVRALQFSDIMQIGSGLKDITMWLQSSVTGAPGRYRVSQIDFIESAWLIRWNPRTVVLRLLAVETWYRLEFSGKTGLKVTLEWAECCSADGI